MLILQSTFDTNNEGVFLQIFMNLTKKGFIIKGYL